MIQQFVRTNLKNKLSKLILNHTEIQNFKWHKKKIGLYEQRGCELDEARTKGPIVR